MTLATDIKSPGRGPALSYYNFDKLFSYNATYMFLVGGRGLGKTYGAKKKVIDNFLKNGEQFIYLRRYKDELKSSKETFFADLFHLYPDADFRVNGYVAEYAPASTRDDKKRQWFVMGYFMPLSQAQGKKSVAYPMVTMILFDEFIIEQGTTHYLPNEATAFNNFYSTVDRWKDKTRVIFMANSVSIMNPYFLAYDIKPDQVGEWHRAKKLADGRHFIVCHFPDSAAFSGEVFKTAFGQFIAGTEYAEYAVGNQFADNHDALIALKPSEAKYAYSIETEHGTCSVWIDWRGPYYYVQTKRPKEELLYTLLAHKMDEGKILISYNDKLLQHLRAGFKNGIMWFDEQTSRNAFIEIFKR